MYFVQSERIFRFIELGSRAPTQFLKLGDAVLEKVIILLGYSKFVCLVGYVSSDGRTIFKVRDGQMQGLVFFRLKRIFYT